jgi:hypothetical protein
MQPAPPSQAWQALILGSILPEPSREARTHESLDETAPIGKDHFRKEPAVLVVGPIPEQSTTVPQKLVGMPARRVIHLVAPRSHLSLPSIYRATMSRAESYTTRSNRDGTPMRGGALPSPQPPTWISASWSSSDAGPRRILGALRSLRSDVGGKDERTRTAR